MPICPQGHDSPTADYCDYCGWPMSAPGQQAQSTPQYSMEPNPQQPGPMHLPPQYQQHPPSTAGLVMCPICSTPQTERYCEECGYDYDLRAQQQPPAFTGYPPPQAREQQPPQAPQPPQVPQPQMQQPVLQQPTSPQQPGPQSRPGPGPGPGPEYSGMSQPYQQQPPPQAYQQPQQPQQPQAPQQPQPPQQQYSGAPGTYGGVSYSTGDTSGGFSTDFMLKPPTGEQQQPQPTGRGTWVAVVNADREYFDDMMARSGPDAAGLYFPPYSPERRVPMTGRQQLRIGRRSHQRGTVPEIDLSIAPEDPGASHQHALLQEQPDGGWVVIDQDSTNGTSLNGSAEPIAAHQPVPLQDGDRIHVGAWTTITVHRA